MSDPDADPDADLDAVVVGAGPNGLAAAIVLARHGLSVEVYEAEATVGGGARTEELTLPGFRHDPCSAVHPLGVGSPLFRALPLERHGLDWVHAEVALAHPRPGGRAAVLVSSVEETAAGFGADRDRYRRWVAPFVGRWDDLARDVLAPLTARRPDHPVLAARFGATAVRPAVSLARRFDGEDLKAVVAGLAAHAISPLGWPGTAGVATMFAVAAHAPGWPFPRGGTQAISDALAAHLGELGGRIVLGHRVARLDELPAARAYLLDLAVPGVIRLGEGRLPAGYLRRLRRVRHGPAAFKLDYALSDPVPWSAPAARRAGTVHIGASFGEIAAALGDVAQGRVPERPFLIAAQPSRFDPTRAPEGRHVLWVYGHVPFGWHGDLTEPIEDQIERYAPGFRDTVLARCAAGPSRLEARNANYVGGDIATGRFGGLQAVFRPVAARVPYATPDPALFLCSSATPPGPGVHGMCGAHAAATVLRRRFGVRHSAFWEEAV